ncbi:MAG: hypothetical protein R3F29_08520 [Planctomycetota bacterium]
MSTLSIVGILIALASLAPFAVLALLEAFGAVQDSNPCGLVVLVAVGAPLGIVLWLVGLALPARRAAQAPEEPPKAPPRELDGADVVLWAWSSPRPFFVMPFADGEGGVAIHGLAILRYGDSGAIARVSCNAEWETENDSPQDSVESAKRAPSAQFDVRTVRWRSLS